MSPSVWWRGVFQRTVWSHYNTARIPERYQHLYQIILPFKFGVIGLYGALSWGLPITSIDFTFGPIYGDLWSIALAVSGFGAMVGIMFYDWMIKLEAASLVFMLVLMAFYVVCIFTAAIVNAEDFRFLSLLLVIVFLPMPSWRLGDIIRELRPARNV